MHEYGTLETSIVHYVCSLVLQNIMEVLNSMGFQSSGEPLCRQFSLFFGLTGGGLALLRGSTVVIRSTSVLGVMTSRFSPLLHD